MYSHTTNLSNIIRYAHLINCLYLFLVLPFWVLSRWGGNSTHTWPAADWTAERWLLYTPHTWHQQSPVCHLRSPCRALSRWLSVSPEWLVHSGSSKQGRKCRSISKVFCVKYQVIIKHTNGENIECYTVWRYINLQIIFKMIHLIKGMHLVKFWPPFYVSLLNLINNGQI